MSFKFKQFVLEVFMAIFGAFSIYSFYFAISGKATASSLMDKKRLPLRYQ